MKGVAKSDLGPKSFVITANLVKLDIHTSHVKNCKEVFEPPRGGPEVFAQPSLCEEAQQAVVSENALQKASIHLNHYKLQSLNWFKKTKMTRGRVIDPKSGTKKYNLTYFKKHDFKDIFDNELSLQTRENYTPGKKTMPIWLIILIIGLCILVIVILLAKILIH